MTVVLTERLEAVRSVPLGVGCHSEPPEGEPPCGWCVMELLGWVIHPDVWTDQSERISPVIGAFLRRYNDLVDQGVRDRLGEWVLAGAYEVEPGQWVLPNVGRLVGTANDGRDEERGYLAADWAVRVVAPVWLELAGANEAAAALRKLPQVTKATAADTRAHTREIRRAAWERRDRALVELRAKVKAAVKEALKDKPAAGAAGAAGAAERKLRDEVYDRVYKAVKDITRKRLEEKLGPQRIELQGASLELLDALIMDGKNGAQSA